MLVVKILNYIYKKKIRYEKLYIGKYLDKFLNP